jgi:hypothetical protein
VGSTAAAYDRQARNLGLDGPEAAQAAADRDALDGGSPAAVVAAMSRLHRSVLPRMGSAAGTPVLPPEPFAQARRELEAILWATGPTARAADSRLSELEGRVAAIAERAEEEPAPLSQAAPADAGE